MYPSDLPLRDNLREGHAQAWRPRGRLRGALFVAGGAAVPVEPLALGLSGPSPSTATGRFGARPRAPRS